MSESPHRALAAVPPAPDPAANGVSELEVDFRALVERVPAVTYVAGFGEDGEWLYVSPQIESMLGFTSQEWRADPDRWMLQIHPDDRRRVLQEEQASLDAGEPLRSEYRIISRDGRTIWVRDEAVLVHDDSGQPTLWEGVFVEITKEKWTEGALEESEAKYRTLFEDVPVALYRTTPRGEMQDVNFALAFALGYPDRASLVRLRAEDLYVNPEDRDRWMALMDSEGLVRDCEMQLRKRDGSLIWVRDSARTMRDKDGRVVFYEGTLQDITEQKAAEEELRRAKEKLESWVGELEHRNQEMTLINEMGDLLQGCPDAQEAYAVIAHWVEKLFADTSGALFVISSSRNMVESVAEWGQPKLGESVFSPDSCWALRGGRTHRIDDPDSRLVCRHLIRQLDGAYLCVPMMAQGEALGVLHVQSPPPAAQATELEAAAYDSRQRLATAVAEHVGLALANLKLRETLRSQSIRDPLTGLFNRRYMEESLDRELRRAARKDQTLGVIMLDIDHFNHFNNTFGHQAGDTVLREFGEIMRGGVRAEDIACRYGGEEFILILPEAGAEILLQRAELIREDVRRLHAQQEGQSLGRVTVSMGVAVSPRDGRTADELIGAADRALYRAKNEGRDRVILANNGAPSPEPQHLRGAPRDDSVSPTNH